MTVVAVPIATLWRSPETTDPDDVLTQLLLGEPFLVEEVRADGWVRGVALDQPADRLDPRGYPGWLAPGQLGANSTAAGGRPYTVDSMRTTLRAAPDGAPALADVWVGTRLSAVGDPVGGWLPVRVPGHDAPLWAVRDDLAPAGPGDPLALAHRMVGTAYVWGGLSPSGIDCSGLVHLSWRRYGVTVPRDAADQTAATTPVPAGAERPGDLYIFARPGKPVHHIGFVVGPRRMLHACYTQGRVVVEPIRDDRQATLIGARRVPLPRPPAGGRAGS